MQDNVKVCYICYSNKHLIADCPKRTGQGMQPSTGGGGGRGRPGPSIESWRHWKYFRGWNSENFSWEYLSLKKFILLIESHKSEQPCERIFSSLNSSILKY